MEKPKILIAAPLREEAENLEEFLSMIEHFKYPKRLLSFAFLVNNSTDTTYKILQEWKNKHRHWNIWLKNIEVDGDEEHVATRVAKAKNYIIDHALKDQQFIFWIDGDIKDLPPDSLTKLIAQNQPIIAPLLIDETGRCVNRLPDFLGKTQMSLYHFEERPLIKRVPLRLIETNIVLGAHLVKTLLYKEGLRYYGDKNVEEHHFFCSKAQKRGWFSFIDSTVTAHHKPKMGKKDKERIKKWKNRK